MAIEKEIIAQQLRDMGLDENLSNFLNFEDETAMGQYFEMQAKGQEGVIDLSKFNTVDELIDAANKGDLKLVQGALDKTRQDTANKYKTQKQDPPKPSDPPKEDPRLESMQKQLDEFFNKEANKVKQEQVAKWAKAEAEKQGVPSDFLKLIKLTHESSKDDVVSEIGKAHAILKQMGVNVNGVPSSGSRADDKGIDDMMKKWKKNRKK